MQDPLDSTSAPASAPAPAQALPDTAPAQAPVLNPVDETWARKTLVDLAFANLKEQQSQRRWKLGMRLAWLLFVGFVVWQVFSLNSPATHTSFPHTALVTIQGEIGPDTEASAQNVMTSMRTALEDSGSQALILLINSPGGSPVQAGLINDEITRLRALHNKPIYAVVEESCASAAYYIAAATDQIYVDKASLVGSIGVLMDGFGFTGLMDKLGVERRLMTAGENKGFLDPFSPQTAPQRQHAQAMLDQIHKQFIEAVRKGRGERLKDNPEMFSGLFWSGQQAVDLGLADGLGSIDGVARDVVKAPDVIDYTQRENVAERLVKRFGVAVGEGSVRALRASAVMR
jgi:protease-4